MSLRRLRRELPLVGYRWLATAGLENSIEIQGTSLRELPYIHCHTVPNRNQMQSKSSVLLRGPPTNFLFDEYYYYYYEACRFGSGLRATGCFFCCLEVECLAWIRQRCRRQRCNGLRRFRILLLLLRSLPVWIRTTGAPWTGLPLDWATAAAALVFLS